MRVFHKPAKPCVVSHSIFYHLKMYKLISAVLVLSYAFAGDAGVPQTCKTVYEDKCWDEPREKCETVQKPYTMTEEDTHCVTHYDEKCDTEYITKVDYVDREECHTNHEQKCHKKTDRECSTKQVERSHHVPEM